jgi:hypothetical protein
MKACDSYARWWHRGTIANAGQTSRGKSNRSPDYVLNGKPIEEFAFWSRPNLPDYSAEICVR